MTALNVTSEILGWLYTILWSCVFIPQLYTNFSRKSVSGISIEFLSLNMIGYLNYFLFVWVGSYFQREYNLTQSIVIQDKIFATFGFIVVYTTAFQAFVMYPKTRSKVFQFHNIVFVIILLYTSIYNIGLGLGKFLPWFSKSESYYTYSVLHCCGFTKSICSLLKYIPQVYLLYMKQNTIGFSISGPTIDLLGGLCSLLQQLLKCFIHRNIDGTPNWNHLFGNIPKLMLNIECIIFDIIFIIQHFILYRANNERILALEKETGQVFHDEDGENNNDDGVIDGIDINIEDNKNNNSKHNGTIQDDLKHLDYGYNDINNVQNSSIHLATISHNNSSTKYTKSINPGAESHEQLLIVQGENSLLNPTSNKMLYSEDEHA